MKYLTLELLSLLATRVLSAIVLIRVYIFVIIHNTKHLIKFTYYVQIHVYQEHCVQNV